MFDSQVLTEPGTVLLDTSRADASNRVCWCFTQPNRVLRTSTPEEVRGLLEDIQEVTEAGGYVAGFLSYEAGYPLVDLSSPEYREEPLAWFGVYDRPATVSPPDVARGFATLDTVPSVEDVHFDVSQNEYVEAIEQIRHHIEEGDVYQINYTAPVRFRVTGDPRALYRRLRHRQHVPYGAYLNLGERQILSCSPELFFRRDNQSVVTRPMKGTIRRGRTLEEDRALQEALASDPKNRAENLMIVDLLRNDLSRCCEPGSVTVPDLYATEPYDTVTQMTSTVEGRLRPQQGVADVLQALFPCGSVTGAPKRRAMRLIRSLEISPRGVYCGAIGMAGPESAVFNVAIRTAVIEGEEGQMGVGSGVVWDSDPEAEYEECELKTQFLTPSADSLQRGDDVGDLRLIETMRFDGLRFPLLDRHIARLSRSAAYFGYPFDADRFRQRVEQAVSGSDPETVLKVRATLDRWGRIEVEITSVPPENDPWTLTVAAERADRTDPLFFHKTTHRRVYEQALSEAQEEGYDEALLLNQDGEVTEGTCSNVFIQEGDRFWTPPVESGLLAGVYRAYVLEVKEQAQERVLTIEDVREADAVFCCNAVRGWCPAVLDPTPVPTR